MEGPNTIRGSQLSPVAEDGLRACALLDEGLRGRSSCDLGQLRLESYDPSAGAGQVDGDTIYCPTLRDQLEARPSPFTVDNYHGGGFVSEEDRVALQSLVFGSERPAGARLQNRVRLPLRVGSSRGSQDDRDPGFSVPKYAIRAGPRETIYHNPRIVNIAVVTCGLLCPGLNDVIRGIQQKALDYGVRESNILGIRYGFKGFYDRIAKPIVLTRELVEDIHMEGGTILGVEAAHTGVPDVKEIVKRLDLWKIDFLFVIGGRGGNAGAQAIHEECRRSGVPCCVVAVPKSIDNDILVIDKTFGAETAVEEAQKALLAAKVEASSAYRGVGLVKMMGRQSGFIAVQASLASGVVDAVLIPEVPFKMEGDNGFLAYIAGVVECKGHAVICISEGAGQDMLNDGKGGEDESGHPILADVGLWMKRQLKQHLRDADIKYIEPSYLVRSIPTNANDRIYCKLLAHGAVHAAFAGYSGVTVGLVNTHYVLLPIPLIIHAPCRVDPRGDVWNRVRASIGQPNFQ